jgi:hypothetical protein
MPWESYTRLCFAVSNLHGQAQTKSYLESSLGFLALPVIDQHAAKQESQPPESVHTLWTTVNLLDNSNEINLVSLLFIRSRLAF